MQLRRFVLGVVGCACGAMPAGAQMLPAVVGERQIHANLNVATIYEDNFSRSSKILAAQRGIKQNEVTVRPQVNVDVVQPVGQQIVYLRGGAGYDFHRFNNQLDRARADLQGGYVTTISLCQASVYGNYRAGQSDLALLDSPGVKNLSQVTGTAAGVQCGRPGSFVGGMTVQRTEAKNSAAIQKEADSTVETLSAQLGYSNSTIGQVGLTYAYSNNEFPNRLIPGRPVGDGFFTQTFGVTAERQFNSRLKATAAAGRTTVKREFAPAGTDLKFTSSTYSALVNYRLGNRLTFELSGDRAVIPTARAGKLYDIATTGELRGTYRFGSRYMVSLGGRVEDIKSNPDTTLARPIVTDARTKTAFGSITYSQSRRASLVLDVRYDDRNTNLPDFNYTSTRVGITAEVGF